MAQIRSRLAWAASVACVFSWGLSALGLEVQVVPLTGSPVRGELRQLNSESVVVEAAGEQHTWSVQQLRRIDLAGMADATRRGSVVVELTDGSRLLGQQFLTQRSSATFTPLEGSPITIRTSAIRHVTLQDLGNNETLWGQWAEFTAAPHDKDLLVFRRDTDGVARLDVLEGVVHEVKADELEFEYDGDRIQPKRDRIIGIVYFHAPTAASGAAASCQILDAQGASWRAARLTLENEQLSWITAAGVESSAPLSRIRSIDYAAGNLQYLSELKPESQTWRPYIESRVPAALLARRYAPRFDEAFDGGPLLLGNQSYAKGLALHSYTELVYRLPADFQRFRALAGIDDRVRKAGVTASVRLQILVDDKTIHEQMVLSDEEPRELDLDVSQGKRLRIIVDYGDDLDISDYLNLCEARLTK